MFKKNKDNDVHALMVEHLQDIEECLINFEGFIRAATTPETVHETLRTLAVGVGKSENAADYAFRRMVDSLGASYLASTREEIISLASSCDKIANKCETAAKMIVYQQVKFPVEFTADFMKIISVTKEQFDVLEESINMFFNKFGAMLKNHDILDVIRKHESSVDVIEEKLQEQLFSMKELHLSEKLQLSQIIELICDISDIIENIADRIQIMLISRKV